MIKNRINMVINCLLVSVLFFTSCKSRFPSVLTDSDKQYINDLTTSTQDGWNRGERETYVNRFSTDAIYMPPNTETVVGKDAIQTFVNSFPELKIYYTVIEIMGSSDYAFVRGEFKVTNPADTLLDKGKFLSVWKKFPDGKWLLTHDIFSSDLPIPVGQGNTDQNK
jgi:ketosteroid isomerase-like protein